MRIAREDGLRWRSVGLALWSTEALIFYYKENFLAKRDLEEGRDRRRLKLSTLTDYGKEQDMEIEALEAMLMDLEKFILARVALILLTIASKYQYLHRLGWLAVLSSWCCVFFSSPEFGHALMLCSFSCAVLDS
uniref:Uncharacterized protein n=1 Tax=Populus alba TaxID=43335 RepID=A0A4U5N9C8_POPAL|nr:hypothetical protein D5086_0000274730 [Populus alba]